MVYGEGDTVGEGTLWERGHCPGRGLYILHYLKARCEYFDLLREHCIKMVKDFIFHLIFLFL